MLLHGWGASGQRWELVARELACAYRVLCPDLPGHGAAPLPPAGPAGLTIPALADWLAAYLAREAPAGATVAGWSLGGMVLLELLAAGRGALARRAVFVSTTSRFLAAPGHPGMRPGALRRLAAELRRDYAAGLARFRALLFAPGERAPPPEFWSAAGAPEAAAALFLLEELGRFDRRAALPGIATPALVLHGAEDGICPVAAGRLLAAGLPRARLVVWPGVGHAPLITARGQLVAELRGFAAAGAARDRAPGLPVGKENPDASDRP